MAETKGLSKQGIVKFIKDEITETEQALAFVVVALENKGNTQFNHVYVGKKREYEGMLSALYGVLEAAEGKAEDNGE